MILHQQISRFLCIVCGLTLCVTGLADDVDAPASTQRSPSMQLPALGDALSLSLSDERKIGDRIARELYKDPDFIDDPVLLEYVQNIWASLVKSAQARGDLSDDLQNRLAWKILLTQDRSVNAFALPGGYLGVHLGLIGLVSSKDELASVLAHELSHVTQRHIARLFGQQEKQTPLLIGAMILGALAASKSPDAANALIIGGQAVAMQNQLNFSRDMEREADRVGYNVMTQAGFEAQGFVSMFEKLQHASRINDNGSFPYLRSHPLTTERIADMQARQQLQTSTKNKIITPEHAMISARARVLGKPNAEALRLWRNQPDDLGFGKQNASEQISALYAATLIASKENEHAKARSLALRLLTLLRSQPNSDSLVAALRLHQLLQAEIDLKANRSETALALKIEAPTQRPELVLRAKAAQQKTPLSALDLQTVSDALRLWVAQKPEDALAWQTLAASYSALNQPLRALRAEAEAQIANLDYSAALDRLKAGQDFAQNQAKTNREKNRAESLGDEMEASIIDMRARAVMQQIQEQHKSPQP